MAAQWLGHETGTAWDNRRESVEMKSRHLLQALGAVVVIVAVLAFDKNKLMYRFSIFEITIGMVSDRIHQALGIERNVKKRKLTINTALLNIEAV
jgi:hypothetical protein